MIFIIFLLCLCNYFGQEFYSLDIPILELVLKLASTRRLSSALLTLDIYLTDSLKMRSNTIGYSLLLVIQMIYEQVLADFEQHCTYNDYYARRNVVSTCGSHLTAYVMDLCHNQPYLGDYSGYRCKYSIGVQSEILDKLLKLFSIN